MAEPVQTQLTLPLSVINKVDVGRLLREVSAVDEFLRQASIRQPGTALKLPKTGRLVEETVQANDLNLLVDEDRQRLIDFLSAVLEKAPQLHMSFSAEPSPVFLHKITDYLRQNIHPHALLQVGLQPTIGAGFMLRTTNKYYDFSIRTTLKAKRDVLMHNIRSNKPDPAPQAAAQEPRQ